jgi:AcrR family transcriptional regulator
MSLEADPSFSLVSSPSPLRRQPQQKRSQQRVEKLLQAAAEVFVEVGYEAATTHMIAARAKTAIGSLYQFFPDKLALFHALEARHMEQITIINAEFLQAAPQPLEAFIDQMVEVYADYFQDVKSQVVYIQYFVAPELFQLFDDQFNQKLIDQLATFFRHWHPHLELEKSRRLAETVHCCYNSLLLNALRGEPEKRQARYQEIKALLVAYLSPHVQPIPTSIKSPQPLQCPECDSERLSKNGHRYGKQRYLCKNCGRQFLTPIHSLLC